jgi:hypothetical protein
MLVIPNLFRHEKETDHESNLIHRLRFCINLLYKDESMCVCVCMCVRRPAAGPTQAIAPKFGDPQMLTPSPAARPAHSPAHFCSLVP